MAKSEQNVLATFLGSLDHCEEAYVEKKGKCSRMGDNANIANADTRPSVI